MEIGNHRILVYTCLLVLPILMVALSRVYWSRRLKRWAEGEKLEIVSFHGAKFYEGPGAMGRSENQSLFRVVTRDKKGRERSCWVQFGSFWGMCLGEPLSEVTWDSDRR